MALRVEAALSADVFLPGSWLTGAVQVAALLPERAGLPVPPGSSQQRSGRKTQDPATAGSSAGGTRVAWVAVQAVGVVSADKTWLALASVAAKQDQRGSSRASSSNGSLAAVVVPPGALIGSPLRQQQQRQYEQGVGSSGSAFHSDDPGDDGCSRAPSSGGNASGNGISGAQQSQAADPKVIASVAQHADAGRRLRTEWEKKYGRDYASQQQFIFASPTVLLAQDFELGYAETRVQAAAKAGNSSTRTFSSSSDAADRAASSATAVAAAAEAQNSLADGAVQSTFASFEFAVRLPYVLPPSFSGCGLRYRYFVYIYVASLRSASAPSDDPSVSVYSVPFRVINPASAVRRIVSQPMFPDAFDFAVRGRVLHPVPHEHILHNIAARSVGLTRSDTQGEARSSSATNMRAPARARHRRRTSEYQELQQEHDMVQSLSAVRQVMEKHAHAITAAIRRARPSEIVSEGSKISVTELVATVSLSRTSFTLGDVVEGVVHFPCALGGHFVQTKTDAVMGSNDTLNNIGQAVPAARCFQMTLRLEVEETLDRRFASPRRGLKPHIKSVAEFHSLVESSAMTSFALHIPAEATPEMTTDLISVRWLLHFEFVVSPPQHSLSDAAIREAVDAHVAIQTGLVSDQVPDNNSSLEDDEFLPRSHSMHDSVVVVKPSLPLVGRPDAEPLHWSLPLRVLVSELPAQPIAPRRHVWLM